MLFNLFISVLLQSFGKGGEEDELTDDKKVERMFDLPDYLYNIKESLKFKKTNEKIQRRNKAFESEAFQNDLSKSQIQNSKTKSHFANTNSKSNMNNTETRIFKDDDEENNEEEEYEENDYNDIRNI